MEFFYQLFVVGIPVVLAITLHEAAHGYVALRYGDDTALRMGRVTLNPLKHIDLIGTVLIPGALLLMGANFLFGYAKPVPVNFERLKRPRRDSILVAIAGPGMNVALAFFSALAFHIIDIMPADFRQATADLLTTSIFINIVLAIINMIPILPLDGGRVLAGILPGSWAKRFSRIEPYGLFIILGLFALPLLFGLEFNIIFWLIRDPVYFIVNIITIIAGLN